jgi:hypothetical protein
MSHGANLGGKSFKLGQHQSLAACDPRKNMSRCRNCPRAGRRAAKSGEEREGVKDIEGTELACISSMESDTVYRLFRKDGHMWVRVWVHFRATIFEGVKEASNYEIHAEQFNNVVVRGSTLKSLINAKLLEIDSN